MALPRARECTSYGGRPALAPAAAALTNLLLLSALARACAQFPADEGASSLFSDLPPELGGDGFGSGAANSSFGETSPGGPPPAVVPGGEAPFNPAQTGTVTSLLDPPPGFGGGLTQEQAAAAAGLKSKRQGTATVVYDRVVGNLDGQRQACRLGYLNNYFTQYFVGLPKALFREGQLCGVCVNMWCVDSACRDALLQNRTFMVTDSCQDCKGNSLVASAAGLANLTGLNININPTVRVAWEFVSCDALIQGGIRMLPSDQNAATFLGINFSNVRGLIKAVKVNDLVLDSTTYGFWVKNTPGKNIPLRPPYTIALLSTDNQVITKTVPTLQAQDLGINFT